MMLRVLVSLGLSLALAALPPASVAQSAPPAAAASAPAAAASQPRNDIEVRVIEDDQVRIEETRVRGLVRRIVVHDKTGKVRPYEVLVGAPGRDPTQDKSGAGQRVWSVLRF